MQSPRIKIGRNDPCPCESGKKYKKCCYGEAFQYVTAHDRQITRRVPLSDEAVASFIERIASLDEELGREPDSDDPLLGVEPEHVKQLILAGLRDADIDLAFLYVFEKTGLLVTEDNLSLIPESDLMEWHAAWDEYEQLYGTPRAGAYR